MLKDKRVSLVKEIDNEIAEVMRAIECRCTHPAYPTFDKILTDRVTAFEKDTLERKVHKLQRDRYDYKNDNVKFWKNKKHNNQVSAPTNKSGEAKNRQMQSQYFSTRNIQNDNINTNHPRKIHTKTHSTNMQFQNTRYADIVKIHLSEQIKSNSDHNKKTNTPATENLDNNISLNLPPTSFLGAPTFTTTGTSKLTGQIVGDNLTKIRNMSSISSSASLDDSLYTVYNTPKERQPIDMIDSEIDPHLPITELNFTHSAPSTSESFLGLPPTLTPTHTYHIKEDPPLIRLVDSHNVVGLKRKLDEGIEGKRKIEIHSAPKKNSPSPKRNKLTQQ